MSFVGPRPERPEFVEQLSERVSYYNERHRVKPGITGWAQLHYIYSDSIDGGLTKLQYDLYYVRHFSLLLDLFIVIQTVRVILWPAGARQGGVGAVLAASRVRARSAAQPSHLQSLTRISHAVSF